MRDDAAALQQEPVVIEDLVLKQDLVHDLLRAADEQVLSQVRAMRRSRRG